MCVFSQVISDFQFPPRVGQAAIKVSYTFHLETKIVSCIMYNEISTYCRWRAIAMTEVASFSILGLSLRFSLKIKWQVLNITATRVWYLLKGAFTCIWIYVCLLRPCVSLVDVPFLLKLLLFTNVIFCYREAAVHFRASDYPPLTTKLLPPCHYGDTGCYTSANHGGAVDVWRSQCDCRVLRVLKESCEKTTKKRMQV